MTAPAVPIYGPASNSRAGLMPAANWSLLNVSQPANKVLRSGDAGGTAGWGSLSIGDLPATVAITDGSRPFTGPIGAANGSASVPSITFANFPAYGLYFDPTSGTVFSHNGVAVAGVRTYTLALSSASKLAWSNGEVSGVLDLALDRSAASTARLHDGSGGAANLAVTGAITGNGGFSTPAGYTVSNFGVTSELSIHGLTTPDVEIKHAGWRGAGRAINLKSNVGISWSSTTAFDGTTGAVLDYPSANTVRLSSDGSAGASNLIVTGSLNVHGSTPLLQQTVSGSRGGNAALADLLTKLANLGFLIDGTIS